ncbi:hypothetical protein HAX54_007496 [Datura stramonium]|uniref:Uncharacterized protein n=1 Tax=Datura stramonium TaxID=4076 RepID=A0ABS8TDG7_DATST|nr:hypothetical protein [Datura stramonium]
MTQKFSFEEQARLVWQYLCSVPLMILEDSIPLLTASLSSHEKVDFLNFVHIVVPEEKLIGECREMQQQKASEEQNPVDGFHIWHAAITRDLKCRIIWFSVHSSEDESKLILNNLKLGFAVVNKSFATLLYEWVRMGYSGKISVEKFEKIWKKCSVAEAICLKSSKNSGSSSSYSVMQSSDRSKTALLGPNSAMTSNNTISYHPSTLDNIAKHDTPYSNGINLHIFFSDLLKNFCCLPETALDVKLAEDMGLLAEFEIHSHHVRFLYQLHRKGSKVSLTLAVDPLEVVSTYLSSDGFRSSSVCHEKGGNFSLTESADHGFDHSGSFSSDKTKNSKWNKNFDLSGDITQHSTEVDKKRSNDTIEIADQRATTCQNIKLHEQSRQREHKEHHLRLTQDKLVDVIRRVSCDSSLDSEKKSHLMQSVLMSQMHFQLLIVHFLSWKEATYGYIITSSR